MDHLDYRSQIRRICDVYQLYRHFLDDANSEKAMQRMFRSSNLQRIKSGAFKARKAIPAAVRAAYQRLYGRGWEAHPARRDIPEWGQDAAEWLALVERRVAALQTNGTSVHSATS